MFGGFWIWHLGRMLAGSWIRNFDGILDVAFGMIVDEFGKDFGFGVLKDL